MSLQIKYSKEIAKELGKIAVYLPGDPIEVGDIITFPYGKTGLFSKEAPLGAFQKISSLQKLDVSYGKPEISGSSHSYKFSSRNSVNSTSLLNSEAELIDNTLPNARGQIKLEFASEGSIYLHAQDCYKRQLGDLSMLENEIIAKSNVLIWDNTYLVTSVTYAQKALVIQSISKNGEIIFEGNIHGIQSTAVTLGISSEMTVKKQNGDFFIKEWSKDVTLFMDLMKFEKKVFGVEKNRNLETTEKEARLLPVDIRKII